MLPSLTAIYKNVSRGRKDKQHRLTEENAFMKSGLFGNSVVLSSADQSIQSASFLVLEFELQIL